MVITGRSEHHSAEAAAILRLTGHRSDRNGQLTLEAGRALAAGRPASFRVRTGSRLRCRAPTPPLPIFNRQESRRQQVLADDDVERVSDREGGSLGDHTLGDLAATAVDAGLVAPKPRAAPAGARSRARMPQSEPERSRVPRAV